MEMAAKTWKGDWWKTGGGATPWDGILYDPQTDLVIFGTGNGAPWPAEVRSPGGGDNLFTASIVALDAKTGKYKWHYQAVPMDSFDFDNTSPLTIADLDDRRPEEARGDADPEERRVLRDRSGHRQGDQRAAGRAVSPTGSPVSTRPTTGRRSSIPMPTIGKTGKGWLHRGPFQTHVWNPQSFNPEHGPDLCGRPLSPATAWWPRPAPRWATSCCRSTWPSGRSCAGPKLDRRGQLAGGLESGDAEGSLACDRGQQPGRAP